MKRVITALLALAVFGGVLVGCSGGSDTGTTGTGGTEQPKDTGTQGG